MSAITLDHRALLGKRSTNGKMAMPLHPQLRSDWIVVGAQELLEAKIIYSHGRGLVRYDDEHYLECEVFQLTEFGFQLCETHDIWAMPDVEDGTE